MNPDVGLTNIQAAEPRDDGQPAHRNKERITLLHDKDIREPLFDFLEETYGTIRILEEKNMGRSRADIVMVTPDGLTGIEIKSDADTYARLARQVRDYDRYYDRNMVVAGTTHAMHIEEHVPPHWGIITVELLDGVPDFYMLRTPKPNPGRSMEKKLALLWRPELFALQQAFGLPKYKDKNKNFVISRICERIPGGLPEEAVHREISRLLFERDYTKAEEMIREYRKGELQKALERETDPEKQLELMLLKEEKARGLKRRRRRR